MDDFLQLEKYTMFEKMPSCVLKNITTTTALVHAYVSQEILKNILTWCGHTEMLDVPIHLEEIGRVALI